MANLGKTCAACLLCAATCLWGGVALAGGNEFNPWIQSRLPAQKLSAADRDIVASMGGKAMSIQDEAAHRPQWRTEAYPVVFGNRTSAGEILVFIDYANPQSAALWQEVINAVPKLNPQTCKIAVFGNSAEKYGTELMGAGIWLAVNRPAQGMDYFRHTLNRWNEIKAAQRQQGRVKRFDYEYDATLTAQDFPMIYTYLQGLKPPVESFDKELTKYCYDAGNVNLYQAASMAGYYGVSRLPAVVVNGKRLSNPSAAAIVQALR